ncbi:MAG: PhnD/SsuA/transferrin family substrate-binding protein [Bythopirellula sp.]
MTRLSHTVLTPALAILFIVSMPTLCTKAVEATDQPKPLTIVVMDPLAAPLSCPCVEGYAQRDYQQLADFIGERVGLPTKLVFHESLAVALQEKTQGQADLVIGKDSVVRSDAERSKLQLLPLARLTGKDGTTTQTGLIIVRTDDPAQSLAELEGYRFLFGPADCSEKYQAARDLLTAAGVSLPEQPETSAACSDGACKIIEWGNDVRAATVISSYAKPLLEGCGTIAKGDLRVIAETKPVPFVTAFVNRQVSEAVQKRLQEALLEVGTDAELLTALESLMGFEPIPEEELRLLKQPLDTTSQTDLTVPTDDSWPGWRGRGRDGHCGWLPKQLPEELQIVWREQLSGPGLGGVAANNEYVIIGDRDLHDEVDVFRCYAAKTGRPLWTFNHPAPGQLDYGNTPRATPLIAGDYAYLQGAFGDLHCVEIETGTIVWSKNFEFDFGATADLPWGTCGSPLIAAGKLIVNPGAPEASLVALDPLTGETLWQSPGDTSAYGSFIAANLGGILQVIGHDASSLGGWDLATGRRLWELLPEHAEDFSVPTPVVVDGKLLVTSENNGTRLFEFDDAGRLIPEPVAINEDLASDTGTPVVVGEKVFAVWSALYCLDVNSGLKTLWSTRDSSFRVYGSLLARGDRLLITGASGELLLLDTSAADYDVVSRLSVFDTPDAELYSHPAMVGSRLYLRGEDALVCVELSESAGTLPKSHGASSNRPGLAR